MKRTTKEKRTIDPERKQPLMTKFKVTRRDGSSRRGQKHAFCEYFVLDYEHDKFAVPALRAYAKACAAEYPLLAKDLERKVFLLETMHSLNAKS
jgi:hypothetical protein